MGANDETFRAIVENTAEPICLFDAQGIFSYVNSASARIFDYQPEELIGKSGWTLIHPDDHAMVGETLTRLLAMPGKAIDVPRYRVQHRNGTWRWVEAFATNLLHLPSVGAIVANYRDVTEQILLEEQLRHSQKMEAIGLLAGGVAHDFNNLLTIILGSADHAAQVLPSGHPARADLASLTNAAMTAAGLTQKLLTFARRQVRLSVVFDLRNAVKGFAALLERIVGEDISIEMTLPEAPLWIDGDQAQMQQVLLNLATNARQAMPRGGRLRMSARRLPVQEGAERCELEVADTGIGMTAETKRHVFEPFWSSRQGGTGLGMAVVFSVVQEHQGAIEVDSVPGKGTAVRIILPLRGAPPEVAPPQGGAHNEGSETILLAEDEPRVRDLLSRALGRLGYTVLAAGDGVAAVDLFMRERQRIALVVLDTVMPGINGSDAFRQMQALRPDLKGIFISGYAPQAQEIAGLTAQGRVSLLQKPFVAAELATQIRLLLDPR